MADAPAPSGGSGWGALEVIVVLVLVIGLISTISGKPILSLRNKSTIAATKTVTAPQPSCGIVLTSPKPQEKIGTEVVLNGSIIQCLTNTIPDTLTAHVVDATGTSLSDSTTIDVSHSIFGGGSFSTTIPLVGTARSTKAYVIVSGPVRANGTAETVRLPIQLIPADGTFSPAPTPSTFSSSTTSSSSNYYPSTAPAPYPSSNSGQSAPTYTAPPYSAPAPSSPSSGSGQPTSGGGRGTTF
jgi:hypothetical protein